MGGCASALSPALLPATSKHSLCVALGFLPTLLIFSSLVPCAQKRDRALWLLLCPPFLLSAFVCQVKPPKVKGLQVGTDSFFHWSFTASDASCCRAVCQKCGRRLLPVYVRFSTSFALPRDKRSYEFLFSYISLSSFWISVYLGFLPSLGLSSSFPSLPSFFFPFSLPLFI